MTHYLLPLSETMSLSQTLWKANQDLAQACLNHPFVQGIADGSLSSAQFAYYVGQDAFFLESFARAYSVAGAKASEWEGFKLFHRLADGVLAELQLHSSYAEKWGVDLEAVTPGTATRQYTDFLMATAWSQPTGVTAVAMSPCMKLYSFLGQGLAQGGISQHRYTDWITTYSDEEFGELVRQLEGLVDAYAQETELVHSTYRYAMICERDFFQSAWNSPAENASLN
jgi:thiaminase/transcriptional activator TenA